MAEAHDFLAQLNPQQRAAVEYCDGPSLVIAGAGSGKTRVLTYKIAYLLEQGYEPWTILALTFTNKAADEMKARIARQVGGERARYLWMGTFHSIFARILRTEAATIGLSPNFTIYDAADSKSLARTIIREMQLDDKKYKASRVLAHISSAKNRLILPNAYMAQADIQRADAQAEIPATGQIYARYQARCRQADALDFDDILLFTYYLFRTHPEIRERYEARFRYVLVDEYQDTNYAQHAIVWQLTEHNRRVCVVGDDAQSIYSFRGANIDNILTFQQLYSGARLFKLEQNYRSTQNIVNAANSLIHKNRGQIQKNVFSNGLEGQKIHAYQYYSDIEEANGVAKKVIGLRRNDHIEWQQMAVLYRTNAQSRTFEEAFRKNDIPYRVYGGTSFYQRKEIKDIIAYFRLTVNPNDEEALKRIINYPARGIGSTTIARIAEIVQEKGISFWEVIKNPMAHNLNVSRGVVAKLSAFVQMIEDFHERSVQYDAAQVGRHIAKASGIVADIFQGREPDDLSRQENLQELLDGIQQFVDDRVEEEGSGRVLLTDYLQEISLLSTVDETGDDNSDDKVALMTVHSAKGLEYKAVFIVGLEEDLFPNEMASGSPRELEEERRLLYVAITRAKELCFITFAKNRYRYGKPQFSSPSRFLNDIDPQYIQFDESAQSSAVRNSARHSDFSSRQSGFTSRQSGFTSRTISRRLFDDDSFFSTSGNVTMPPPNFKRLQRVSSGQGMSSGQGALSVQGVSSAQEALSGQGVPSGQDISSIPASSSVQGVSSSQSMGHSGNVTGSLNDAAGFAINDIIFHQRFGRGRIVALTDTGIDAKATIEFDNVGRKQLLLRFAKITKV